MNWTDEQYAQMATLAEQMRRRAETAEAEIERLRTAYNTPLTFARERDEARAEVERLQERYTTVRRAYAIEAQTRAALEAEIERLRA